MHFDFWYGNTLEDVARADCYFSDADCRYQGNMWDVNGKMIGDYWSEDSVVVEEYFPGIFDGY